MHHQDTEANRGDMRPKGWVVPAEDGAPAAGHGSRKARRDINYFILGLSSLGKYFPQDPSYKNENM